MLLAVLLVLSEVLGQLLVVVLAASLVHLQRRHLSTVNSKAGPAMIELFENSSAQWGAEEKDNAAQT